MLQNKWTDEHIIQWVIIITVFLFVSFPNEMIRLSETSLGKLYFALIIVYYSMVEPIYGIIVCSIVISYYQLDLYNSIIAVHRDTLLSENMEVMAKSLQDNSLVSKEDAKLYEPYVGGRDESVYSYTPFATMMDPNETVIMKGSRKKELLDYFRKTHCDEKNRLRQNGSIVPLEMTDHVFREIQFPTNSSKCNPCEESCEFSIVEERLNREEQLRPTFSKDQPIDWNQFFGHYLVKPVMSMMEDFAEFEETTRGIIQSKLSGTSQKSAK
jgi:hypothetical protein